MRAAVAPYGPHAVALQVHDVRPQPALTRAMVRFAAAVDAWPEVAETVVAYREVLVRFRKTGPASPGAPTRLDPLLEPVATRLGAAWAETLRGWSACEPSATDRGGRPAIELRVRYDGADLVEVARRCARTVVEVIALHTAPTYHVYALGFQPGFAFLGELPEPLRLPRRSVPRTRVPAGAVAMAAAQTGVYPHASPGGWHLLGQCLDPLFDPAAANLCRVRVGDSVRFVPVR